MRLSAEYVCAIKAAAVEAFGPLVVVRLFGSRVDETRRGGDIDLHFEVEPGQQDYKHIGNFKWALFKHIEEQRVDVVPYVRGRAHRSIDDVAFAEGIIL